MSRTSIPQDVKLKLWLKSGGRCQFRGCNKLLYRDNLTKVEKNSSYFAHIIADSPDGTRGDENFSPKLAKEFSNLMLLCDTHHRLIDDKSKEDIYTVDLLQTYKREHEERIEYLTSINENYRSHLLFFKANIGERNPEIDFEDARHSILPRYPAESKAIELDLTNSPWKDNEENYFKNKQKEISQLINTRIRQRSQSDRVSHLSIFALAPIPLLIHFGCEIGELIPSDVYQRHRAPCSWKWQLLNEEFQYIVKEPTPSPDSAIKSIALNLSLSGTIQPNEIDPVMQEAYHTYKITIAQPNRNYLKSKEQLELFKAEMRVLLRQIRETHGAKCEIHLFPAIPASVAVSLGQLLLPKSDPLIHVYEHNNQNGGFRYALTIRSQKHE